jgi:hypothetical protein
MMHSTRGAVVAVGLVTALMAGGVVPAVSLAEAEEQTQYLNNPDAINHALEQQVGKRVKVKLVSGQDLEGKVAKVGSHAVHLSELSGMEFFDATIRVDQVAAVIVRVRTK